MSKQLLEELNKINKIISYSPSIGNVISEGLLPNTYKIFIKAFGLMAKADPATAKALQKRFNKLLSKTNSGKIIQELADEGVIAQKADVDQVLNDILAGTVKRYKGPGSVSRNRIAKWMEQNPSLWYRSIEDVNIPNDVKLNVIKVISAESQFQNMITSYMKKSYDPDWRLLPKTDSKYHLGQFIKMFQTDADFKKLLDGEFVAQFQKALDDIPGIKSKIVSNLKVTGLKTLNMFSGKYKARLKDAIENNPSWGPTIKWSVFKNWNKVTKQVKNVGSLLKTILFGESIKGFITRIVIYSGLYLLAEYLIGSTKDLTSLLSQELGEDNLWQSLPPTVKTWYGLPQTEAQTRAQTIYDELYGGNWTNLYNVEESVILDELTKDKTSYLQMAQISYEFMMLGDNEARKPLFQAMDEQMSSAFDQVGSFFSDKVDSDAIYTVADLIRVITKDTTIPKIKPNAEYEQFISDLNSQTITDIAQIQKSRLISPVAIEDGKYGLYNKTGKYFGPNGLMVINDILDKNQTDDTDFTYWYEDRNAFKKAMFNTSRDDWANYSNVFAIVPGTTDSRYNFTPKTQVSGVFKNDNSGELSTQWDKLKSGFEDLTKNLIDQQDG